MTLNVGNKGFGKPNSAHADLQEDVCKYWRAKSPGWIPVKELDLGSRSMDKEVKRADVFAITDTYPPRFVICEVKVSRADFLRGVKEEQYLHYMDNCNLFYFVTPWGLLKPGDKPLGCGWLEQWENKKGFNVMWTGEENHEFKMNDQLWYTFVKKLDGG